MPIEVTVYRRENCSLCEKAMATVERVVDDTELSVSIEQRDVDTDSALQAAYSDRVPVIAIDGEECFELRLTAAEFRQALHAAAAA